VHTSLKIDDEEGITVTMIAVVTREDKTFCGLMTLLLKNQEYNGPRKKRFEAKI
jgi:hypothetical protein